jgi:ABC-type dipeptide/oligopeptide/nickel transport system permease component
MLAFIVRRLLAAIPVILGASFLVFALMSLMPGDVADMLLDEVTASPEQKEALREQLGLNDPFFTRYLKFLSGAVRGDLGRSFVSNRPVLDEVLEQIPRTVELAVAAMVVATILGLSLGILSAINQNTWIDNVSMAVAMIGVSMPIFWLGLLLILVFAVTLGWLPALGQGSPKALILPAVALGVLPAASIARLVRSSMLEVLRQEYVVTARAKGLRDRTVIIRHALKNALIPTITILGLQVGSLLSGAVLTETIFARQGLGSLTVSAIVRKDFPLVQACILVTSIAYVLANIFVDLSYAWFDPRIRYE